MTDYIKECSITLSNGYIIEGRKDGDFITVIRPGFSTQVIPIDEFIDWLKHPSPVKEKDPKGE